MSYYIDIIDTLSNVVALKLEKASASGITLKWNGGDAKDELAVVSSELDFNMLSPDATDATFLKLFTGDEERFRVELRKEEGDVLLWQGHILPDQYSEPYKNGCFFVSFAATDGLGRLKGKFLPDAYYSEEKSVIDIFCQCLQLTGLQMDLYFNPAIENFVNKNWNAIYIDTLHFINKKKKQNAFQILETLLKDTLCVCYQADNRWYIEGINTRHIRKVNYSVFGFDGAVKGTVEYNRLLKTTTNLPTPVITMIPPYNEITVTHPKIEPSFPATVAKETNDGWAVVTGVVDKIDASSWISTGGVSASCVGPNYEVGIYNKMEVEMGAGNINFPQDNTQWISLKKKLYVAAFQKAAFKLKFKIKNPGTEKVNPTNMNLWRNPFKYEILFNGAVIFSNYRPGVIPEKEQAIFDDSGVCEIALDKIFSNEGLIDVRLYRPFGAVNVNKILAILVTEIAIEVLDFQEEDVFKDLISADFTIDKEVELTFGNDKSGFSKGFLLSKLRNATALFNEIEVPILYGFTAAGKHYSVVQLAGANLIAKNLYTVYKSGVLVIVNGVHYNFNNGEQMVVETSVPYTSGSFMVKKYAIDDHIDSRSNWLQWTDSVYKIENFPIAKTVANIYRRLFNVAHEKLDMTVKNAVKFNDIILFHYVFGKEFYPLNCSWNIDDCKSTLTLARSLYKNQESGNEDDNVPPIVLAGDDIYLSDAQTTANLLATAYDPDGFIVSQIWTLVSGDTSMVINSPLALQTALSNLIGDSYVLQIQVTDNDGATASDSLSIIRIKEYEIIFELIDEEINEVISNPYIYKKYKIKFDPEIPVGMSIVIKGDLMISNFKSGAAASFFNGSAKYSIFKNTVEIETEEAVEASIEKNLTINYIQGDEILFETTVYVSGGPQDINSSVEGTARSRSIVTFDEIEVVNGFGTFTGLPQTFTEEVSF